MRKQGVGGEVWGGCVCLVEAERAESRRREPRGAPGTWAGLSFLLADVDAEICSGVAWGGVAWGGRSHSWETPAHGVQQGLLSEEAEKHTARGRAAALGAESGGPTSLVSFWSPEASLSGPARTGLF